MDGSKQEAGRSGPAQWETEQATLVGEETSKLGRVSGQPGRLLLAEHAASEGG